MEKEYAEALLKDIEISSSTEEKTHLMTVFLSELSISDGVNRESVLSIKNTLELSAKTAEAFTDHVRITSERILELEEYLRAHSRQTLSTAETVARNTEALLEIHEYLHNILIGQGEIHKQINRLSDRIEKLEDR